VVAAPIPTGHPGVPQKGQTDVAAISPVNPSHHLKKCVIRAKTDCLTGWWQ